MKVLISAYACEPHAGSEPGVGWNWSRQAALRGHDVHVITRSNNRESIQAALADSPVSGLTFHYLDLPRVFAVGKKKGGTLSLLAYYYMWQIALALKARRLNRQFEYDLVHHVTFANDWLPAGISLVPDVPFVWGPIGGSTHRAPRRIEAEWPSHERRYERLRRSLQKAFLTFDPLLRWTRRRASVALPYTEEAKRGMPNSMRLKSRVVRHIGVDAVEHERSQREVDPLEIVTGGRLVHWKGFDLLLEGLAIHLRSHPGTAHLTVTGTGPWLKRLTDLASQLGIDDEVDYVGHLPGHGDVLNLIRAADLYALPTWRDGPPVAILEAMSVARPILCLDIGATAELVPRAAGILIPPSRRAPTIQAIGDALSWCVENRVELAQKGETAASYVQGHYLWSSIGDSVESVYAELSVGEVRPSHGSPE